MGLARPRPDELTWWKGEIPSIPSPEDVCGAGGSEQQLRGAADASSTPAQSSAEKKQVPYQSGYTGTLLPLWYREPGNGSPSGRPTEDTGPSPEILSQYTQTSSFGKNVFIFPEMTQWNNQITLSSPVINAEQWFQMEGATSLSLTLS